MENGSIDELLSGSTAEEKLKNAIEVIQSLEKEVFKLRAELKRSEIFIKKLQESSALSGQNNNNTSSVFLLPSEFKKLWDVLIMENILDLFSPFFSAHQDFLHLAQGLIQEVIKNVETELNEKISQICKILGAEGSVDKIKKYLLKLFQDNYVAALPCPFERKIADRFLATVPKNLYAKAKKITGNSDFEEFVKNMHKISVFMLLNDPSLEINFKKELEYVTITKPEDFCYIDGFPVGNTEAAIIIPCVTRNNYPYAGIKPSVLIVSENSKKTDEKLPQNEPKTEEKIKIAAKLEKSEVSRRSQNFSIKNRYDDDQESYPPLQNKKSDRKKEAKDCVLCKVKAPCAYCSKNTLLALAKRIPSTETSQRHLCRIQSSSFFSDNIKNTRLSGSILSRRLSEAAKKLDKKTFIKNKYLDKEACKVM